MGLYVARYQRNFYVGRRPLWLYRLLCLRITDVEPITLDLYFERFKRATPHPARLLILISPGLIRTEVMDYVLRGYGENMLPLLGMVSTFQYRAAIRGVAKLWGLPKRNRPSYEGKYSSTDRIVMAAYCFVMQLCYRTSPTSYLFIPVYVDLRKTCSFIIPALRCCKSKCP